VRGCCCASTLTQVASGSLPHSLVCGCVTTSHVCPGSMLTAASTCFEMGNMQQHTCFPCHTAATLQPQLESVCTPKHVPPTQQCWFHIFPRVKQPLFITQHQFAHIEPGLLNRSSCCECHSAQDQNRCKMQEDAASYTAYRAAVVCTDLVCAIGASVEAVSGSCQAHCCRTRQQSILRVVPRHQQHQQTAAWPWLRAARPNM
jgi:hypothetical protein